MTIFSGGGGGGWVKFNYEPGKELVIFDKANVSVVYQIA